MLRYTGLPVIVDAGHNHQPAEKNDDDDANRDTKLNPVATIKSFNNRAIGGKNAVVFIETAWALLGVPKVQSC